MRAELRRVVQYIDEYKAKYEGSAEQLAETCTASFGVCHGDLHLGNLLCDPVTGLLTAVIDWESVSWGPREADAIEFSQMLPESAVADTDHDEGEAGNAQHEDLVDEATQERVRQIRQLPPIPATAGSWERGLLVPVLLDVRFLHYFNASWWGHFIGMERKREVAPGEAKEAEDTVRNSLRRFFELVELGPPPQPPLPQQREPELSIDERDVILRAVKAIENAASSFNLVGGQDGFNLAEQAGPLSASLFARPSLCLRPCPCSPLTLRACCEQGITDAGAVALANVLPGSRVRLLLLNGNKITDRGAARLAKALVGSSVSTSLRKPLCLPSVSLCVSLCPSSVSLLCVPLCLSVSLCVPLCLATRLDTHSIRDSLAGAGAADCPLSQFDRRRRRNRVRGGTT